ncbi:MAG: ComEC/Rec2 family competence protein [Polyangiaceae bacterium]
MSARDPLLWVGIALVMGAPVAVAPAIALASVAVVLVALHLVARLRTREIALVVVALALSAARARVALDDAAAQYTRIVEVLRGPTRCVGDARVTSSPIVRGGTVRARFAWVTVACADRAVEPFAFFAANVPRALGRGDRVAMIATLAPTYLFRNEGSGDGVSMIARARAVASGVADDVSDVKPGADSRGGSTGRARRCARRSSPSYHEAARPLGRALVLGETDLAEDDDEAFRASGLSHMLAVSGTHIVVAILGLVAAARFLLVRWSALAERTDVGRWVSLGAVPLAFAYADFAGGGGSALRAAAMTSGVLLARAVGRASEPSRALALAFTAASAVDPLAFSDASFGLSTAATLGLVCLSRPLARRLAGARREGFIARVRRAVSAVAATTLAPTIACAPVLASLSPRIPLAGLFANVIAAPLGETIALPVCLLHAIAAPVPVLGPALARVGAGALLAVQAIAHAAADTGLALPVPPPTAAQIAVISSGAMVAAMCQRRRWIALLLSGCCLVGLELAARTSGRPTGEVRVTALDVGQGDSLLVDLPDGSLMVIDGGGLVGSPVDTGKRVLAPVLRARRRSRVDVVVLSHPHPDHFTGLLHGLDGVEIGEIWDTGEVDARQSAPLWRAFLHEQALRGVRVVRPPELCGRARAFGGATVEALSPCPLGDDASTNDNSLVLRVRFGARSALLMGDAERDTEALLVDRHGAALRSDLLKAGHHGSRTSSSPAFIDAVDPADVFVSCGVRNRFDHPHANTLRTLASRAVHRTDRGGEWRWSTNGEAIDITSPFGGDALDRATAAAPSSRP